MQGWQSTYLGLKDLPREISGFELHSFFTFSRAEREVIDGRHGAIHRLGLALRLFEGIRPVRALLAQIGKLPWQAEADNPVLAALNQLLELYAAKAVELPAGVSAAKLGRVWSAAITGPDRNKAMRALEVATLFGLRRAVRNGSVWVDHSQVFRGRARLFFTPERWAAESKRHYARLDLPTKASAFLKPLLARVQAGVAAVAQAARNGMLSVDDELHLTAMPAEDEARPLLWIHGRMRNLALFTTSCRFFNRCVCCQPMKLSRAASFQALAPKLSKATSLSPA